MSFIYTCETNAITGYGIRCVTAAAASQQQLITVLHMVAEVGQEDSYKKYSNLTVCEVSLS